MYHAGTEKSIQQSQRKIVRREREYMAQMISTESSGSVNMT